MREYKYNYVICGSIVSYFDLMYRDLKELENVRYFSSFWEGSNNRISYYLKRATFSEKINKFIKLPFSRYTFPRIYPFHFNDDKPICFVFFETSAYMINTSYMEYLSLRYPNSKKVLYMQDLVSKNPFLNLERAKKVMDLIISYDKGDCERYNFLYSPTPMSKFSISENDTPFSDVYFCGLIKSQKRYDNIMSVYNLCKSKGLKCLFYLVGVPVELQKNTDGIIYNKKLSYIENLKHVDHTKCILEVMQEDADGYTLRLWESFLLQKHLLTNNKCLKISKYKELKNIHYTDFDLNSILDWIYNPVEIEKEIINSISPISLLKTIDNELI